MAQILEDLMGNVVEIEASTESLEASFRVQLHMYAMYQLI